VNVVAHALFGSPITSFVIALWSAIEAPLCGVKRNWEIIADNLSKAGWSWGCVATVDREGRTIYIADAHRDDGKRFVGTLRNRQKCSIIIKRWQFSTPSLAVGKPMKAARLPAFSYYTKVYYTKV
jgi:hypothetical protein